MMGTSEPKRTPRGGTARWRAYLVLRGLLIVSLVAAAVLLLVVEFTEFDASALRDGVVATIVIVLLSAGAEYIDSSIGMGYGTVVAPVLVIFGFDPVEVIPAVLVAEAVSGVLAGWLHGRAANFDLSPGSKDRMAVIVIGVVGAFGAVAAAVAASGLEATSGRIVMGTLLLIVGLATLLVRHTARAFGISEMIGLGVVAAAAKGLSGGGFGPIVTGGQIAMGVPGRNAVGVTSLSEGAISAIGAAIFVAIQGWPPADLTWALVLGGLVAVPPAVWTVRLVPVIAMRRSVGLAACGLAVLVLLGIR